MNQLCVQWLLCDVDSTVALVCLQAGQVYIPEVPGPKRHHIADLIERRRLCCQNVQLLAEALVVSFYCCASVWLSARRCTQTEDRCPCGSFYFCTSMWLSARRCTQTGQRPLWWVFTVVHLYGLVPEGAHRQGRGPCGEYLLLYICMAECQKVLTDRGQRGREMKCGTSHYRLYFQNLHCIDVSVREDNEFSIFWWKLPLEVEGGIMLDEAFCWAQACHEALGVQELKQAIDLMHLLFPVFRPTMKQWTCRSSNGL